MRLLVLGALLVACSSEESRLAPPAPPAAALDPTVPVDGDMLVIAAPFDPGNLNPVVSPYALSYMLGELVQPGLVRREVEQGGLVYAPWLASEWAFSEDGTELTYTLAEGRVWEDGTPFTSRDVAFTHSLIADPVVASNWHGDSQKIAAVETPDDQTVVFRFTAPRNPILQQGYTLRGIVPEHALVDADRATLRGHASARAPLSSGPYRVAEWAPDIKVVFERNETVSAEDRPHIDRIIVKILPEYSTRIMELQRGSVDLVQSVEIDDIEALQDDPDLAVVRMVGASMSYVGYDLTDERFSDVRVRTALTQAVDRERLIRDFLTVKGSRYGQACTGTVSPALGGWHAMDVSPLPYDAKGAGELLDAAGWTDSDGDGVRDRGGRPLRYSLMVQTGGAFEKKIAVMLQAYWEAVGVAVDIDLVEPTRFAQRAREHDFEAMLWSFGANPKVDPSIQWRTDGQYNWYQYSNPEVDALIDAGIAAVDVTEAQQAFQEIQRKVYADQAVTFLFWQDDLIAIDKRFQGVQMNTFSSVHRIEDWWVPLADQRYR